MAASLTTIHLNTSTQYLCACMHTLLHLCLVECTLMTDCWRALTFTPSSIILIRVLQFVPPHLVRKLLQSSSNPPSKSRDHELMKPQEKRERCVFVFGVGGVLSLFVFLPMFLFDCCTNLSCPFLNSTSVFLDDYLLLLSTFSMVDQSLSLNIIMLC